MIIPIVTIVKSGNMDLIKRDPCLWWTKQRFHCQWPSFVNHSLDVRICDRFPFSSDCLWLVSASPCTGKTSKDNVQHPTDVSKYISCLSDDKYEIMDCPFGLIYNANADQCEVAVNTESLCQREQPCLNEGQCYQTSPSSFKCTCRGPWTGERCETPVSSCVNNPCGEGNECQTLITSDYKQDYVCICDKGESYGSSCDRSTFVWCFSDTKSIEHDFFSLHRHRSKPMFGCQHWTRAILFIRLQFTCLRAMQWWSIASPTLCNGTLLESRRQNLWPWSHTTITYEWGSTAILPSQLQCWTTETGLQPYDDKFRRGQRWPTTRLSLP